MQDKELYTEEKPITSNEVILMNIAIRYYTRSGNTKKLAGAIAHSIGVNAETIEAPIAEYTDILFLGSSVYAAGVDESVKRFIGQLDPKKVGKVVNFSTAALLPSTYKQVKELVEKQGIQMEDKEYHCKGSFGLLHRTRPDQKDLQEAELFTRKIIESK